MATRRSSNVQAARRPQSRNNTYIYGNTVRRAEVMPERQRPEYERPPRPKKVSRQIQKNRKQALHMNPAYVAFLTIAAIATLAVCVWYLQLRAELTSRSEHITELQQELADSKEENTTRYNAIIDSVNLEEVRDRAINELGMVYAKPDQIITYQNPTGDYVKQYQDIPKSGIAPQSDKIEK